MIQLFLFIFFQKAKSFSIPGVSLKTFKENEVIPVEVNELDSLTTLYSLSYYDLNFCKPDNLDFKHENLGSELLGEQTQNTPFIIFTNKEEKCKLLCKTNLKINETQIKFAIDHDYKVNFIIDNLPAVQFKDNLTQIGYRVGFIQDGVYYINNHINLHIHINQVQNETYRVVQFDIHPKSIQHKQEDNLDCNKKNQKQVLQDNVIFTYDVTFVEDKKKIGSRWDLYQNMGIETNHWVSIFNSIVVMLLLGYSIVYILKNMLNRDIQRFENQAYNMVNLDTEQNYEQEDNSWKQLSRDVFVAPKYPMLLSILLGTGMNVFANITILITIVCLGFVNITYRGQTLTLAIVFHSIFSMICGYCSARFYKLLKGQNMLRCLILCGSFYPFMNLMVLLFVNVFLELEQSSNAIDFFLVIQLIILYFFIQLPLVFLGGIIGFRQKIIKIPCQPNLINKTVPPQPFYNQYLYCLCIGGILPFGAVLFELSYVMTGLWKHSFYYLFIFFAISYYILLITSAQISVIITYIQLSKGNHRWWWKAYLSPAASSLYIFLYSVVYFFKYLQLTRFSSIVMYFSYMFLISFNFFLISGAIGLLASTIFVISIYSMIKHD